MAVQRPGYVPLSRTPLDKVFPPKGLQQFLYPFSHHPKRSIKTEDSKRGARKGKPIP